MWYWRAMLSIDRVPSDTLWLLAGKAQTTEGWPSLAMRRLHDHTFSIPQA